MVIRSDKPVEKLDLVSNFAVMPNNIAASQHKVRLQPKNENNNLASRFVK